MHIWSDAITHYIATNEDQYGAFRIGPSYPIWSQIGWNDGKYPSPKHAIFGNTIYFNQYTPDYEKNYTSLPGIRMHNHIKEFSIMRDMLLDGIKVLETIQNPDDELQKLINIGWFMYRTTLTVLNVKNFYILMSKLNIVETNTDAKKILNEMEEILLNEKENVKATIPLVQMDSRLGWEPSMEYTTDEAALRWKLKQLDIELNERLPLFRTKSEL